MDALGLPQALSRTLSSATLAPERARKIAVSVNDPSAGDLQVLRTHSGAAVVTIHEESKTGTSRFFVMEKRGADFHVSARGQLATKKFPNADWTAETIDADGDDYDEVLFTGADASGPNPRHRLILYVPENRHMYVLEFEKQ